jgi:hypothetical protein
MLKVKEVFRENGFSKSTEARIRFKTRDVLINPEHIICIRPNQSNLYEGKIDGISNDTSFCTISLNKGSAGLDITVVGHAIEIQEKLNFLTTKKEREVIHG